MVAEDDSLDALISTQTPHNVGSKVGSVGSLFDTTVWCHTILNFVHFCIQRINTRACGHSGRKSGGHLVTTFLGLMALPVSLVHLDSFIHLFIHSFIQPQQLPQRPPPGGRVPPPPLLPPGPPVPWECRPCRRRRSSTPCCRLRRLCPSGRRRCRRHTCCRRGCRRRAFTTTTTTTQCWPRPRRLTAARRERATPPCSSPCDTTTRL